MLQDGDKITISLTKYASTAYLKVWQVDWLKFMGFNANQLENKKIHLSMKADGKKLIFEKA